MDAADGQSPDGVADRFDRGAWQANANIGLGERPVTAVFSGQR